MARFGLCAIRHFPWSSLARWVAVAGMVFGASLVSASPTGATTPSSTTAQSALSGTLRIGGSSALQPLIQRAATSFQQRNEGVQISVDDGGSQVGRTGVCQGALDIGMSDVPLTDAEMSALDCANAVQTAVAIDAFAVVANPVGPGSVHALDREQMEHIFSGDVANWSDVEGMDQPLVVINRVRGSGTRQTMANYLFSGDDAVFSSTLAEEDNSQNIVSALSQTPGSISYLGLAYLSSPDLVTLGVQLPDGSVVTPTRETVANNLWPIGGPGLAITKGPPSALVSAFLNYLIGPDFATDPAWDDLGLVVPASPAIGNQFGQ